MFNFSQNVGSLAYEGHEVRVHDSSSAVLNKVYLRLTEDRRILREDGLVSNSAFIVSMDLETDCNSF